ncbi:MULTISPECIES: DUF427 domain-containing protein [unclassified Mumia]|uniref:DUF427 domain-containing protein n=1 Tax=unclassified Mumia TaxID=2621872 RepID=UPI002620D59B|nr:MULTISPECIES: DUF427 domain-containing protein [unclassified Mumia]MDD9348845.1 DUF427 domain-containing protein [Mumia sp.]
MEPTPSRVRVLVGDTVVADTTAALTLRESTYPPVVYVPRSDLDASVVSPTDTSTYCPFKGTASYVSITTPEGIVEDAGWTYPGPYDAVASIRGHVAFYPDRVTVEVEHTAG